MSAQRSVTPKCPLPIVTTQLARHLLRMHCRLRGELAKASDGEAQMVDNATAIDVLRNIEAVVRFMGVKFDPNALKPVRTRPQTGPLA